MGDITSREATIDDSHQDVDMNTRVYDIDCRMRFQIVHVDGCFVHISRQLTIVLPCFVSRLKQSDIAQNIQLMAQINLWQKMISKYTID